MRPHRDHGLTLLMLALLMSGATVMTAGEPATETKASQYLQPSDLWTAVSASGMVESRSHEMPVDEWIRLGRGDHLFPLSFVRTADRGRTTLTRRGDIIIVSPDTEVILPRGDLSADVIRQNSGKALYKVEPGREGRFEVVTPFLVAGVKGTQFSVQVEEDFVAVDVVEGHVEVMSLMSQGRVDLFEGHMVIMGPDGHFELHREDTRDRHEEKARKIRKETRSLAREAVASLEVASFMDQLKDMLSDSRAEYKVEQKVRLMAERLDVDLEKLKELMEERQSQSNDDKVTGTVKP